MTITPEYGEEERMRQQAEGPRPPGGEDPAEREIHDRDQEEREVEYLEPETNEAHAPGQVCERCGVVITASQDARRRPDGRWIHEVCPPDLSGPPAADTEPPAGG